jgi:L-seryl-tRNA(Ser) seleniumtransferase
VDLASFGIRDEPPAGESLKAGVDVVTFSGDKLLGGPQAGILVGKRRSLELIRKNPLYRALRVDKLTIAALEATIGLYLRGESKAIPALRMLQMTPEEIASRAERLAARIRSQPGFHAKLQKGESVVGGGSTPGQSLPTELIQVTRDGESAENLEALLRRASPPVIARVEGGHVLLDLRTVLEGQDEQIAEIFGRISSA